MTFQDKHVGAILFDMDGTLVASEHVWQQTEAELVTARGFDLAPELQASFTGMVTAAVIRILRETYRLPESEEALTAELYSRLLKRLQHVKERAGVTDLLNRVARSGVACALVSNSAVDIIETALGHQPWQAMFEHRFSAEHVTRAKPAPDIYLLAAKKLSVAPEHCLVLEDSLTGVRAALAAGMTCLAVPEVDDATPFEALTPYVYKHLDEVSAVLQH